MEELKTKIISLRKEEKRLEKVLEQKQKEAQARKNEISKVNSRLDKKKIGLILSAKRDYFKAKNKIAIRKESLSAILSLVINTIFRLLPTKLLLLINDKKLALKGRKYTKNAREMLKELNQEQKDIEQKIATIKEQMIIALAERKRLKAEKEEKDTKAYLHQYEQKSHEELQNRQVKSYEDVMERLIKAKPTKDDPFGLEDLSLQINMALENVPDNLRTEYKNQLELILNSTNNPNQLNGSNDKTLADYDKYRELLELQTKVIYNQNSTIIENKELATILSLVQGVKLQNEFNTNIEIIQAVVETVKLHKDKISLPSKTKINEAIAYLYIRAIKEGIVKEGISVDDLSKIELKYIANIITVINNKYNELMTGNDERLKRELSDIKECYQTSNVYEYIIKMIGAMNNRSISKPYTKALAMN